MKHNPQAFQPLSRRMEKPFRALTVTRGDLVTLGYKNAGHISDQMMRNIGFMYGSFISNWCPGKLQEALENACRFVSLEKKGH
jgi:hypothetical protein